MGLLFPRAAAATLYGAIAKGGYEYDGKSYDVKFAHVQGIDTCIDCHDQHSPKVRVEVCASCHPGTETSEDLRSIRMPGSTPDYDGDALEGIAAEIETLQAALYAAIQAHATNAGTLIGYDSHSHPYFFKDTDGNGQADPDEAVRTNSYKSWTPRLVRAAYNYQYAQKNPCAYVHNGKYIIQVLHDSIADLATQVTVDISKMVRPQLFAIRHGRVPSNVRS